MNVENAFDNLPATAKVDASQVLDLPDDIKNKLLVNELLSPESNVVKNVVLNSFMRQVTMRDDALARKKVLKISTVLDADEIRNLQSDFPMFNLNFDFSHNNAHGYAEAHRKCELELLLYKVGYNTKAKLLPGYDDQVTDIGGNFLTHVMSGRIGIHSCHPCLSAQDDMRYTDRLISFNNFVSNAKSLTRNQVEMVTNVVDKSGVVFCNHVAQNCMRKSVHGMMLHSCYDLPLEKLGDIMVKKGMMVVHGCFIFSPKILDTSSRDGFLDNIKAYYEYSDNFKKISFSFEGDSSLGYAHDAKTYLSYVIRTAFHDSAKSAHFYLELCENVGDVQFYKVVRGTSSFVPRSQLFHRLWFPEAENYTVIEYYDYAFADVKKTTRGLKKLKMVVPTTIYQKVLNYAEGVSEDKFRHTQLYQYLMSVNNRIIVSGQGVIERKNKTAPEELLYMCGAVYMHAYQRKYACGKVLNILKKHVDYNRELAESSLLGKIFAVKPGPASSWGFLGWLHSKLYDWAKSDLGDGIEIHDQVRCFTFKEYYGNLLTVTGSFGQITPADDMGVDMTHDFMKIFSEILKDAYEGAELNYPEIVKYLSVEQSPSSVPQKWYDWFLGVDNGFNVNALEDGDDAVNSCESDSDSEEPEKKDFPQLTIDVVFGDFVNKMLATVDATVSEISDYSAVEKNLSGDDESESGVYDAECFKNFSDVTIVNSDDVTDVLPEPSGSAFSLDKFFKSSDNCSTQYSSRDKIFVSDNDIISSEIVCGASVDLSSDVSSDDDSLISEPVNFCETEQLEAKDETCMSLVPYVPFDYSKVLLSLQFLPWFFERSESENVRLAVGEAESENVVCVENSCVTFETVEEKVCLDETQCVDANVVESADEKEKLTGCMCFGELKENECELMNENVVEMVVDVMRNTLDVVEIVVKEDDVSASCVDESVKGEICDSEILQNVTTVALVKGEKRKKKKKKSRTQLKEKKFSDDSVSDESSLVLPVPSSVVVADSSQSVKEPVVEMPSSSDDGENHLVENYLKMSKILENKKKILDGLPLHKKNLMRSKLSYFEKTSPVSFGKFVCRTPLKLMEIANSVKIEGHCLDLCAAPGGTTRLLATLPDVASVISISKVDEVKYSVKDFPVTKVPVVHFLQGDNDITKMDFGDVGQIFDFVFADGMTECEDYAKEEENFFSLLSAEIDVILKVLRVNGSAVLKLMNVTDEKLIGKLTELIKNFSSYKIVKPKFSRAMSSEKYLILNNRVIKPKKFDRVSFYKMLSGFVDAQIRAFNSFKKFLKNEKKVSFSKEDDEKNFSFVRELVSSYVKFKFFSLKTVKYNQVICCGMYLDGSVSSSVNEKLLKEKFLDSFVREKRQRVSKDVSEEVSSNSDGKSDSSGADIMYSAEEKFFEETSFDEKLKEIVESAEENSSETSCHGKNFCKIYVSGENGKCFTRAFLVGYSKLTFEDFELRMREFLKIYQSDCSLVYEQVVKQLSEGWIERDFIKCVALAVCVNICVHVDNKFHESFKFSDEADTVHVSLVRGHYWALKPLVFAKTPAKPVGIQESVVNRAMSGDISKTSERTSEKNFSNCDMKRIPDKGKLKSVGVIAKPKVPSAVVVPQVLKDKFEKNETKSGSRVSEMLKVESFEKVLSNVLESSEENSSECSCAGANYRKIYVSGENGKCFLRAFVNSFSKISLSDLVRKLKLFLSNFKNDKSSTYKSVCEQLEGGWVERDFIKTVVLVLRVNVCVHVDNKVHDLFKISDSVETVHLLLKDEHYWALKLFSDVVVAEKSTVVISDSFQNLNISVKMSEKNFCGNVPYDKGEFGVLTGVNMFDAVLSFFPGLQLSTFRKETEKYLSKLGKEYQRFTKSSSCFGNTSLSVEYLKCIVLAHGVNVCIHKGSKRILYSLESNEKKVHLILEDGKYYPALPCEFSCSGYELSCKYVKFYYVDSGRQICVQGGFQPVTDFSFLSVPKYEMKDEMNADECYYDITTLGCQKHLQCVNGSLFVFYERMIKVVANYYSFYLVVDLANVHFGYLEGFFSLFSRVRIVESSRLVRSSVMIYKCEYFTNVLNEIRMSELTKTVLEARKKCVFDDCERFSDFQCGKYLLYDYSVGKNERNFSQIYAPQADLTVFCMRFKDVCLVPTVKDNIYFFHFGENSKSKELNESFSKIKIKNSNVVEFFVDPKLRTKEFMHFVKSLKIKFYIEYPGRFFDYVSRLDDSLYHYWHSNRELNELLIQTDFVSVPPTFGNESVCKNASLEQLSIWKVAAAHVVKNSYRQWNAVKSSSLTEFSDVGLLNSRGKFLVKPKHKFSKTYQYGIDADYQLVELDENNANTVNGSNVIVNSDTKLINDVPLHRACKDLQFGKHVPEFRLVNGVPGCGKTTYVINNHKYGEDMILTATKEAAIDLRERIKTLHPEASDEFLLSHYCTGHSYLMNGDIESDRIFVDEALMVHFGQIVFCAMKSKAKIVFMVGDTAQIPYISRLVTLRLIYNSHEAACSNPSEFLNVSHRCPQDVCHLVNSLQKYPKSFVTTNSVSFSMCVVSINHLLEIPVDKSVQYLTYTQGDKAEMLSKSFSNVVTVHEYQGKQAEKICLVRLTRKVLPIFSSEPHILVAISRHTKEFVYYTVDPGDTLANRIGNRPSLRECEALCVTNCKGGGSVEYADPELICARAINSMQELSHLKEFIERNCFLNVESAKILNLTYEHDEIAFDDVSPMPSCDISALQIAYDFLLPGESVENTKFDYYESETSDVCFSMSDARFDDVLAPKLHMRDCLTPALRTSCPRPFPRTQRQLIKAFCQRNGNVPELRDLICYDSILDSGIRNFVNTFVGDRGLFDQFSANPICPNTVELKEWLKTQPDDIKNFINLQGLKYWEMNLDTFEFSLKNLAKPVLDGTGIWKLPTPQTIAAHHKVVNAIFCPIIRQLKSRFMTVLKKNFLINTDKSIDDIESFLNSNFPASMLNVMRVLEVDMSKYDKSQGFLELEIECKIYQMLGFPPHLLPIWKACHVNTVLKSYSQKFTAYIDYQRKSGDASTFFGNTIVLMFVLATVYDLKDSYAMFAGDDSLVFSSRKFGDRTSELARMFNLEAKLLRHDNYYFCSKFLMTVDGLWKMIPDPLKLLVKLGRHDLVDFDHLADYHQSFIDLIKPFRNSVIYIELSRAVCSRYNKPFNDLSYLFQTLVGLSDFNEFRKLWYLADGDTLLIDKCRPSLEI
ncbi:MAG: RNA-dependent RNA polymerase [Sanya virga-like virus 2]|nr:MAG: RNA-dependent RNA polymerase [Sanya virga-like virus 2]